MQQLQLGGYMIELWGVEDDCTHTDIKPPYPGYISIKQVHSTDIYTVNFDTPLTKLEYEADAIINASSNRVGIGVYVADCVPLVLIKNDIYSVIHLSWKTLHVGLLQKVLSNIDRSGAQVYIGPHHTVDTYEVGGEFIDMFESKYLPLYNSRHHLNMVGYIVDVLTMYSITNISLHPANTYINPDRWSYRGGAGAKRNFVGVRPI